MTAEEFLNQKIEEGVISAYNRKHIIPIMEQYSKLKLKEYIEAKEESNKENNFRKN